MFTRLARRRAEEAPLFDIEKKAHWNEELFAARDSAGEGRESPIQFFYGGDSIPS
jgi:hypothetical protein